MLNHIGTKIGATAVALMALSSGAFANHDHGPRCHDIDDADLVETPGGTACPPEHPSCFLGELKGHGVRATTQFYGTSGAAGPSGSPGWFTYSGETQYHFRSGTLFMHETGLGTSSTSGLPSITSAVEIVTGGDGELEGATGVLFVNGQNGEDSVVTVVRGQYCVPRHGDED